MGPIGVQKQEHPNQIFFVECPRFMALATGGGGKVRSRARVLCAFIAAQRRPLTGSSRLCQARCLKRGHLTKEEIWSTSLLLYACTHVRAGVAGQEQAPHGWGAENAGTIGGCSEGRAEHLPQIKLVLGWYQTLERSTPSSARKRRHGNFERFRLFCGFLYLGWISRMA